MDAIPLKDWVFVYSYGNKPEYDDKDADAAVSVMQKASVAFGITIKTPGFITVEGKGGAKSWIQMIEDDFKKNGKPQIVVLFFQNYEEKFYGELK